MKQIAKEIQITNRGKERRHFTKQNKTKNSVLFASFLFDFILRPFIIMFLVLDFCHGESS